MSEPSQGLRYMDADGVLWVDGRKQDRETVHYWSLPEVLSALKQRSDLDLAYALLAHIFQSHKLLIAVTNHDKSWITDITNPKIDYGIRIYAAQCLAEFCQGIINPRYKEQQALIAEIDRKTTELAILKEKLEALEGTAQ
ncbi:MAG: hypothetical protein IT564_11485 [Rhodospirillales bacterium]|nr:hypothetical protein [Rhodospirillales bacterium]